MSKDETFELWIYLISPAIELVGGSEPHEGNLMIHGHPVCDDSRGQEEAMVVCRFDQGFYHHLCTSGDVHMIPRIIVEALRVQG